MRLFLNDIPIFILKSSKKINEDKFDNLFSVKDEILSSKLTGHVLVKDITLIQIERLIRLTQVKKLKRLTSITVLTSDKPFVKHFIKDQFKIIKAAGGLVEQNGKYLMIFRRGAWDLPKGKAEKNENTLTCAVRETEEECSIKVIPNDKICSTWHSYTQNGKRILKKTTWFAMSCLDDSKMAPQREEDIEEVRWMSEKEVKKALQNSYNTIREVFKAYKKKKRAMQPE